VVTLLFLVLSVAGGQAAAFQFHTDDIWLSQHQFLYALGMHEAQLPTRSRRAVSGAPGEVTSRMDALSPAERAQWDAAVTYYAKGPSTRDAVFDEGLVRAATALAAVRDAQDLSKLPPDAIASEWRNHLERVGPIYRRVWWPAHRRANQERRDAMTPLVARHAPVILPIIERAFARSWPAGGFPVHLASYATWSGAYSTGDNLLVVSSQDTGTEGLLGLETLFHEGMHQWDSETAAALSDAAKQAGIRVPNGLSHALIFYTAGVAVQRVTPTHVPYADVNGLWGRLVAPNVKVALDEVWRPFLDGHGTRQQALADIMRRLK
jgi:hypothetical protein